MLSYDVADCSGLLKGGTRLKNNWKCGFGVLVEVSDADLKRARVQRHLSQMIF